jgi:hypothetical protein
MIASIAFFVGFTGFLPQFLPPEKAAGFQVPYRIAKTQHIIVKARINGSAPLNFVIDTGAPAFFIAEEAAKKAGLKPDEKGWALIDELRFEGTLRAQKVKARIETPFQLKGINGLTLAGMELHGLIGYSVLAKYEIHIDAKKDYMTWTPLDWIPPDPQGFGGSGKKNSQGASLEFLGSFMQGLGGLSGAKAGQPSNIRGFTGLVLEEKNEKVLVASVFLESPAGLAGVQIGDELIKFGDTDLHGLPEANLKLRAIAAPDSIELTIKRKNTIHKFNFKTVFGL